MVREGGGKQRGIHDDAVPLHLSGVRSSNEQSRFGVVLQTSNRSIVGRRVEHADGEGGENKG